MSLCLLFCQIVLMVGFPACKYTHWFIREYLLKGSNKLTTDIILISHLTDSLFSLSTVTAYKKFPEVNNYKLCIVYFLNYVK